jgi:hypothetical protein
MYNKKLENFYEKEEHNNDKILIELATYLVNTYHTEKGGNLYKKDLLVKALTNVLGNLILKYQTYEYIQNLGEKNKKYNKNFNPQLLFPMNNGLYTKNKYDPEKYKIVYKNIKTFGLTRRNKEHVIEILKLFNLCTVSIGELAKSKTTTIELNHYFEWRSDIFERSVEINLQFYHLFVKDYLIELINPDMKKKESLTTYIKKSGQRVPVTNELANKTNQINELWPKELKRFFYTRVFNKNINTGARFYSTFNNMPKLTRKKLVLDSFDYVEIDFTAFVPNAMKIFVDGEAYEERPYNKVSKYLIKSKFRKKGDKERREKALQDYEQILADMIKRPMLIIMNQGFYTEENINKCNAVWKILRKNGLANTINELNDSTYSGFDATSNAKNKNIDLYNYRTVRWEEQVGFDVECPHFNIKPSNLLAATKKALKEIDKFMLTSNWGWTQHIESEILIKISKDLKEDGLLPLFVHDAFLVPRSYYQKYKELSNKSLLEIIADFKESLLTDDFAIQIDKEFTELIKNNTLIKIVISRYKKDSKKDSKNEIKKLTMKLIKIMEKDIKSIEKKDKNKFYYSINKNDYWKLYYIIKDKCNYFVPLLRYRRRGYQLHQIMLIFDTEYT